MTVVRLLGTTEVEGQHRVAVRGWRQAGLLVLLCADLGRRISRFRLEDELWGGRSVSEAALRVTVKRLRERFAAAGLEDPIDSGSGGLQLCVDPEDVDLLLFERLVQDGGNAWSKGRSEDARSAVVRALELWVGTPFGELADLPTAAVWAERAARARVDAACVLGSVLLAHDDPGGALGALQCPDDLGYSVSHREDLAELRMLAAGLMGRRDLALGFHRELLEALRSDVGVAPARSVELLRQAIEADDSEALDSPRRAVGTPAAPVPLGGAAVDRTRTRSRPSHMPFVGREDVLEQIRAAHHDGRVVLRRGGAGMGKTRIAAEVARSVSEGGGSALLAGASPLEPGPEVVLLPLRELEACSGSNELAAALAAELPRSDTDLHRMRVHDAALAVLGTLPPGSLVVLEDLQWIDIGAAQLVWHLISRSESVSWLLTTRPGPDPEVTGLLVRWLDGASGPGVRELELEAMPDTEIDRIVRDQLGEGFDDSLLRRIVEQSAGWPLLGVELASHFAAGGDADDAPATISQRVESSLVAMDARARSVTELLAVAEVPLELHVLAPDTDVGRLLPELVSSGLVRSEASSVEITHDLLRASIVAGLGETRLRELHLRSAEVIARAGPGLDAVVARHLLAAGAAAAEALDREIGPAIAGLVRGRL
ncbi:MAG: BTAD domain-containing putative transcriptional regulator [Microthrixaceae bacterium]